MFLGRLHNAAFSADDFITILYIVFAFVTYTLIPVMGSYRKKISFKDTDIVLMALNTIISTLLLYSAFYIAKLSDFVGLLAAVFAIIYLSLGKFVEKFMAKEQKAKRLFYVTGLTFIVLIIPFQFDKVWLSLGWLVEGVALLSYGIYKEIKDFKKAGVIISFLCLAAFLVFDVLSLDNSLFVYKYLAITLGSIIILGALIYKNNLTNHQTLLFKYATTINLWIFLLYITGSKLKELLSGLLEGSSLSLDYLITAAMILVSFLVAYIIPRIKVICDNVIKNISVTIYAIALIDLFFLNSSSPIAYICIIWLIYWSVTTIKR